VEPLQDVRRIAILTHGFDIGGGVPAVARWLRDGLRALGGYGVDVHDLATSRHDSRSRRLARPISWCRSSLLATEEGESRYWGANLVELEFMRYQARRELTAALAGYDLIQVVAGSPAWGAAATRSGVPTALQMATTAGWERQSQLTTQAAPIRAWRTAMTRLTTKVEREALRGADMVLVENDQAMQHVRSLGQARVTKAPPGVDTATFSPSPAGWRNDGHILSVCRLGDPRKGLTRTILAYQSMLQMHPSVPDLVLAGRGSLAAPVAAMISDLGLSKRIDIRSGVTTTCLVDIYRNASVFVQTSFEEGLGMSVIEAMACGLPVVATETAGSRETVAHGLTGWLVSQAHEDGLIAKVAKSVLGIITDVDFRFGALGRERCLDRFSSAVALRRFTDIYDDLLSGRESTAHVASSTT
jgi:glycosyltransferase involved in cell wall biosynthesis